MDREQALKFLAHVPAGLRREGWEQEYIEAVEVATQALKEIRLLKAYKLSDELADKWSGATEWGEQCDDIVALRAECDAANAEFRAAAAELEAMEKTDG